MFRACREEERAISVVCIMLPGDIDEEIENLKLKKVEITNRMNLTTDYDEKEEMKETVDKIQRQIEILEKLKGQ